jgi:uncharacterized glyoxalase superfamily protein PhnB
MFISVSRLNLRREVDKLFAALSTGGKVEMPVNKTFWGAYIGMCPGQNLRSSG